MTSTAQTAATRTTRVELPASHDAAWASREHARRVLSRARWLRTLGRASEADVAAAERALERAEGLLWDYEDETGFPYGATA